MDVQRQFTAINQCNLELKETDQRIQTYAKSFWKHGLKNTVEQFDKLEKRVFSLEEQYDKNRNSVRDFAQLSKHLLEKVEQLGNMLAMLQNSKRHHSRKDTSSEFHHDNCGISFENEDSIISRKNHTEQGYKVQSNVCANEETMNTGFNLVTEIDCNNIMCKGDTAKTDCTLNDDCINMTINTRSVNNRSFKTTDVKASVMPHKNQHADSDETLDAVSRTHSGLKDEKEKNVCKDKFGYKRKYSNKSVDNRVKFHANMAADDNNHISNNEEGNIKLDVLPIASDNIKPLMLKHKRSFTPKLHPLIPEIKCESDIFETDSSEQPRGIDEWLELSRQTSAFFNFRINSNMCKRGNDQNIILVLDCSARVKGKTFESIKELALQFVDGVEQVYQTLGLEDNIGLAVFGGQTKLVHESTSNYSLLKELIGQQVPEGDAPLLGGLLMGMSGVLAGPVITRQGCKIQGRMIVFTDGSPQNGAHDFATTTQLNKSYFVGDFRGDAEIGGVIGLIANADIKIYYVPVGKPRHNAALEQAVRDTNGKIVQPTEMYRLVRMTQVVRRAIEVACKLRNTTDSSNRETIALHMREESVIDDPNDDCLDLVLEYMNPLSHYIRKGKFAELTCHSLQLGDRVRRGPDWIHNNQDSNMPGTVVGREGRNWVQVEWDSGQKNRYQYDENSNIYTIKKVNEPRRLMDEIVAVGCRVVRGQDWTSRDEDGGRGHLGTVLKVKGNGTVVVRWDCKRTGLYNFGCNGVFDLMVCDGLSTESISSQINRMPKSTRHEHNSQLSSSAARIRRSTDSDRLSNKSTGDMGNLDYVIPIYSDSAVSAVWEYMGDNSEWRKYPTEINTKIEKAYGRKSTGKIIIKMDMSTYIVHFTKMVQENPKTKKETPVRRND